MKVFFDVDGVLIDGWHSDPARRKTWDIHLHRDLGLDPARFQKAFFEPSEGEAISLMGLCAKGERDLKDALAEVLPDLGYAGSVDDFVRYWFENDSNINRDVLNIAGRLASTGRAELYLVTAQEHYRAAWLWHDLGLSRHFRDILYSARFGHLKSDARFYEKVNSFLQIEPDEGPVFFDDTESVVRMARAAGWDARIFTGVSDVLNHERLTALLTD